MKNDITMNTLKSNKIGREEAKIIPLTQREKEKKEGCVRKEKKEM